MCHHHWFRITFIEAEINARITDDLLCTLINVESQVW